MPLVATSHGDAADMTAGVRGGVIVEVDETCIVCRKYNRGQLRGNVHEWLFGGVETGTDGQAAFMVHFSAQIAIGRALYDYQWDGCKTNGDVTRTSKFIHFPEVLIIQLNRYVVSNFRAQKLQHAVHFPRILAADVLPGVVDAKDYYRLWAVMIHRGKSMNAGHYYDIIREPVVTETTAPGYSGRLTNKSMTAEAGGCYALIYRRKGCSRTRSGPLLAPALLTRVGDELEEDFCRKKASGRAAFDVWTARLAERKIWLRQLWTDLEVQNGRNFIDRPGEITFLPTTLLRDILEKEYTAFEDCKSVESKYEPGTLSAVSIPLCKHNQVVPGPLNRGMLKAVNTLAAHRLLWEYNVELIPRTGADLCLDCVLRLRAYYVSRFTTGESEFFYPDGASIYIELKKELDHEIMDAWVGAYVHRGKNPAKLLKIKMCSDETIDDLKVRIFETIRHPPVIQLLYRERQILEGSQTLESAKVPGNNVNNLLIRVGDG
uniref:ubiquitinyl hydrolase 1 n=1 Tax=Globodera pallida TaxID=36090 RepID=A0A183BMW3_GLOPA